ncbi:hypothetical protein [Cupriavidus sp. amp6]|uniref:hypothetical protein n=1 Tax=Cupriavidus sp. amp6 TaxID=388051 RepID=UPI0018DBDD25|nr:hypothetical protein [Cupriavidus sp. amp6]
MLQSEKDFVLEVTTAGGARLRYPLQLQEAGDADTPRFGFEVTIPAVDGIQSLRVLCGLSALQTVTAAQGPKPPMLRAMSAPPNAIVRSWGTNRVRGNNLELTWDAARWPWLSVWQKTATGVVVDP